MGLRPAQGHGARGCGQAPGDYRKREPEFSGARYHRSG